MLQQRKLSTLETQSRAINIRMETSFLRIDKKEIRRMFCNIPYVSTHVSTNTPYSHHIRYSVQTELTYPNGNDRKICPTAKVSYQEERFQLKIDRKPRRKEV